ncbi:MAG: response regulator [Desulfuromonadales bacterium]|nr:response regulator [Desulfuromonadales bacterium]
MMKNRPVILVVDDQIQNIQLLEGLLVRQGYEIIQAESGEEALGKLSGNQVDLVLLDVKMPRMSGFEVLTKIRADKKTQRIPVVMITAYKENEARVKALESGCDDFISKPFDQYELLARVKSLLRIKYLNDEVEEARELAENIINTVREPLISLDHDFRVVTASRSFYEFFKVKPEETVGQLIYDLGNKQWDIPRLRELLETILPQHTTFDNYEVEHDFATIGRRIMLLNARQIQSASGNGRIILLAMEDITERKQAEEEIKGLSLSLASRAADLEDSNRELAAFNYTVSHDLRQPLNNISSACQAIEMLGGDKLDEGNKGYLKMAIDGVESMSKLISTLLRFSRSAHSELQLKLVDLGEIANEIAATLRLTEPKRQVTFKIADGVMAHCDPDLLKVVLENFLGNAWKYTGKQREAIIEFGSAEIAGATAFFIRDNGPGFSMPDAEELFIPFKRLPGTAEFTGHGIGLATVERIIRRHGGKVWAEGVPGKGATFYFTVPAEEPLRTKWTDVNIASVLLESDQVNVL